jgi:hypothetical protein
MERGNAADQCAYGLRLQRGIGRSIELKARAHYFNDSAGQGDNNGQFTDGAVSESYAEFRRICAKQRIISNCSRIREMGMVNSGMRGVCEMDAKQRIISYSLPIKDSPALSTVVECVAWRGMVKCVIWKSPFDISDSPLKMETQALTESLAG